MRNGVINLVADACVIVALSMSVNADELGCSDVAQCARAAARAYKEKFKNAIKDVIIPNNCRSVYSVTNVDACATMVYTGCARQLLSVEINRHSSTNETFRFSRRSGEITHYEVYGPDRSGFELAYHTNGTLRSFARISNARYTGKEYRFDLEGRVLEAVDVDNKPVFMIHSPHDDNVMLPRKNHEEIKRALDQLVD